MQGTSTQDEPKTTIEPILTTDFFFSHHSDRISDQNKGSFSKLLLKVGQFSLRIYCLLTDFLSMCLTLKIKGVFRFSKESLFRFGNNKAYMHAHTYTHTHSLSRRTAII